MKKIFYKIAKWYIERYTTDKVIHQHQLLDWGIHPKSKIPLEKYEMYLINYLDKNETEN